MNDNPPKATEKLTAIEPGTVWDVQGRGYVLVSTSLDTGTLKITLELVPLSTFQNSKSQPSGTEPFDKTSPAWKSWALAQTRPSGLPKYWLNEAQEIEEAP